MKKALFVFIALVIIESSVFASTTITDAQSTQLTAVLCGQVQLKLTQGAPFTNNGAFHNGESLEAIEFGTIQYGQTPSINDLYLNLLTNRGAIIVIQAVPQGPLESSGISTKIGYSLVAGSNTVSITNAGVVTGITLHTFIKDHHGLRLFSRVFSVILDGTDIDQAQQGAYSSTVKFNIVVD